MSFPVFTLQPSRHKKFGRCRTLSDALAIDTYLAIETLSKKLMKGLGVCPKELIYRILSCSKAFGHVKELQCIFKASSLTYQQGARPLLSRSKHSFTFLEFHRNAFVKAMTERVHCISISLLYALFFLAYAVAQQAAPASPNLVPQGTSPNGNHYIFPADITPVQQGAPLQGQNPANLPVAGAPVLQQQALEQQPATGVLAFQQAPPPAGANTPQPAGGFVPLTNPFVNNPFFQPVAPKFTLKTDNPLTKQTASTGLPYPYNILTEAYPGYEDPYVPTTHHKKKISTTTTVPKETTSAPAPAVSKRHHDDYHTTPEITNTPTHVINDVASLPVATTTISATTNKPTPFYRTTWIETASAVPSDVFFNKTRTGLLKFTPSGLPSSVSGTQVIYNAPVTNDPTKSLQEDTVTTKVIRPTSGA